MMLAVPNEHLGPDRKESKPAEVGRSSSFKTVERPNVKKKEETIKRSASFNFLPRKFETKDSRLTLDILHALSPFQNGVDTVTQASRDLLLNFIQLDPSVHKCFFPEVTKKAKLDYDDLRGFPIDKLAVALVSEAISKCDDEYKFSCTIEKNNLGDVLRDVYSSVHWKKLGFSVYTKLYPDVVRDATANVSLQDYIDDDGPVWAERIMERLTQPCWTMSWVQKIVRGHVTEEEYNMEMNTLFVKLHMLDPQSVIPAFHFLINQRALPECNLELATRNYLGGPLDCTLLLPYVKTAVAKESLPITTTTKDNMTEIETFFGVEVQEFILSESREIGVWNGRRPDNKRVTLAQEKCIVM